MVSQTGGVTCNSGSPRDSASLPLLPTGVMAPPPNEGQLIKSEILRSHLFCSPPHASNSNSRPVCFQSISILLSLSALFPAQAALHFGRINASARRLGSLLPFLLSYHPFFHRRGKANIKNVNHLILCGSLTWIRGQKKNIHGKTGEI